MNDYFIDGILIRLTNGTTIPIQTGSYVVFNRANKKDVLSGRALYLYNMVRDSTAYWEHFNSILNNGNQDSLNQFNRWGNPQNYRYGNRLGSITIIPRGGKEELVIDAKEVAGFEFNYAPRG